MVMVRIRIQIRHFFQPGTIPDTKSRFRPTRRFEEFEQAVLLWQDADINLARDFPAIGKNLPHEPTGGRVQIGGIMLVVDYPHPPNSPNPPYDRTSKGVRCIDPAWPPTPSPVQGP